MPNLITDLFVDRVDLVEEGANSAAFIELYKRKEPQKMTLEEILGQLETEHAEVVKSAIEAAKGEATKLSTDLAAVTKSLEEANAKIPCECDGEQDENGKCKICGKKKVEKAGNVAFDEAETLKSAPKALVDYVETLKAQKLAAETAIQKAKDDQMETVAIAKAATLKSLPVDQATLVPILKTAPATIINILEACNEAITNSVLVEKGVVSSSSSSVKAELAAWCSIETEAEKLVKANNITKEKAITEIIKAKPKLYQDYLDALEGGK